MKQPIAEQMGLAGNSALGKAIENCDENVVDY